MKKLLIALLLVASPAFAAIGLVKNLGTDPTPAQTPAIVSCNLYRGAALVVNLPVIVSAAGDACRFPAVPILPSETYTASYVNATGFESASGGPFATGSAPGAPSGIKIVP